MVKRGASHLGRLEAILKTTFDAVSDNLEFGREAEVADALIKSQKKFNLFLL